jgi:hypothetical protein
MARFRRIPTPPTRWTHPDSRSPEICSGGFAADVRRSLNAPQRPSQPSQRDDLLFLFFAQDIAHVKERNLPASSMSRFTYPVGRFSGVHVWPVLGVPRGSNGTTSAFASLPYNAAQVFRPIRELIVTTYGNLVDGSGLLPLSRNPSDLRFINLSG